MSLQQNKTPLLDRLRPPVPQLGTRLPLLQRLSQPPQGQLLFPNDLSDCQLPRPLQESPSRVPPSPSRDRRRNLTKESNYVKQSSTTSVTEESTNTELSTRS